MFNREIEYAFCFHTSMTFSEHVVKKAVADKLGAVLIHFLVAIRLHKLVQTFQLTLALVKFVAVFLQTQIIKLNHFKQRFNMLKIGKLRF